MWHSTYTNILLFVAFTMAANQASLTDGCSSPANMTRALEQLIKEQVVGDVIDSQPNMHFIDLDVEYPKPNLSEGPKATYGHMNLTPTDVKDEPNISYKSNEDKLYTLVMTDPDAPSRTEPTSREFLHWIVVNIPGRQVSKGDVLAEYIGAGPPKGTGFHRYVFLLYEQNGKIISDMKISKNSILGRPKFSARNWAKANNLGSPIAANFFLAEYDDYVPKLHAQLRGGT